MKDNEVIIKVVDIIGSDLCLLGCEGDKVYGEIVKAWKDDKVVVLSFDGVDTVASCFLNSAVGKLYDGEFDYDFISESLFPMYANMDTLMVLKKVVDNAKNFFGVNKNEGQVTIR